MLLRLRTFLMLLILAFVVTAAGCGGPETVNEPPRVATPAQEEQISKVGQGGTSRIVLPESLAPDCMNPYLSKCGGAAAFTGMTLESPLVLGPSAEHRPLLAEAVPSFEGGTLALQPMTVEVRLRRGVNFSDGEPLTSADARWTYEEAALLARNGGISAAYSGFARVKRVETPDDRTVRLVLRKPYSGWRNLLTAPILPRHVYEDRSLKDLTLTKDPIGSGPFLLKRFARDGLRFIDTPRYWVSEPPYPNLEGIRVDFLAPARVSGELSAGRADFGVFQTSETVPKSGDLLRAAALSRVELLVFNSRRLDDTAFRERVARSIDRRNLTEASVVGAEPARSFVLPESSGYAPAWDRSGGASDAGSGTDETAERTLDLVYPAEDPVRRELARKLAAQLSETGSRVLARPVSAAKLQEVLEEGEFELALYTTGQAADLEPLLPMLPPDSRRTFEESLGDVDGSGLARAQETLAEDAALVPLFLWPDTYSWSSTLSGPRPDVPYQSLGWNIRGWGFYE